MAVCSLLGSYCVISYPGHMGVAKYFGVVSASFLHFSLLCDMVGNVMPERRWVCGGYSVLP